MNNISLNNIKLAASILSADFSKDATMSRKGLRKLSKEEITLRSCEIKLPIEKESLT